MRIALLSLLPSLLCAQLPPEPASIQVFQATAQAVRRGGTVTLRWSVAGTDRVRLEPLGQDLPSRGELTQPVNGRTVFWLHATNLRGGQSMPLVVELLPDDQAFPNLNGVQPLPAVAPPVPAAPASRWALIIGDSITEGCGATELAAYSHLLGQVLQTQGYEYCVSACGWSGWIR